MKKMTNDIEKKFEKIIQSKDIKNLESITIFQIDKNSFDVFNKFKIIKKNTNEVIVTLKNGDNERLFSSIQTALCWCIFERRGKFLDSNRIFQIDTRLSGINVHIEMCKKLFKRSKTLEEKLIFLAKLNEDKLKKAEMQNELDDYIIQSNYWQRKQLKLKTEE